jgi:tRNA modification GTPase
VRRALRRAEQADLRLLVFDARTAPDPAVAGLAGPDAVLVANKADLASALELAAIAPDNVVVSAATGLGLDVLRARILAEAEKRMDTSAAPAVTRARHRSALLECIGSIDRALDASAPELVAEDARLAARALGRITGRVEVDDLLDVIFREFCIGK